ncbi:CRISPR-associated protein Cas4 [Carboxydocella sp. ULO1]|uniref:CRISPR-associated protein Cas4 n=1 Tax=Carboxydocella sp. ULO1 TaxID=1926599 RepID=UPI001FA93C32|nr:CRISPR-associated protein Cas4 [Carboxydocella sp. ULO1]
MAHQIVPDQEDPILELGRLIDNESYLREKKKKIHLENMAVDLIKTEKGDLLVGEVKKSSRAMSSARFQLLFYLYCLEQSGLKTSGVLLFPAERRKERVELTEESRKEVEDLIKKIQRLILQEKPPSYRRISYCSKCAYKEFCQS